MSRETAEIEQLRLAIRRLRLTALAAVLLAAIAVLLSIAVLALAARNALREPPSLPAPQAQAPGARLGSACG
jgi:hypothetical protein